jgi:tartrate dehydratase beta subunit/fumarate hydratase class I family protein
MLEDYGVIGMIGKAERGKEALESIKKNKAGLFDRCWWFSLSYFTGY